MTPRQDLRERAGLAFLDRRSPRERITARGEEVLFDRERRPLALVAWEQLDRVGVLREVLLAPEVSNPDTLAMILGESARSLQRRGAHLTRVGGELAAAAPWAERALIQAGYEAGYEAGCEAEGQERAREPGAAGAEPSEGPAAPSDFGLRSPDQGLFPVLARALLRALCWTPLLLLWGLADPRAAAGLGLVALPASAAAGFMEQAGLPRRWWSQPTKLVALSLLILVSALQATVLVSGQTRSLSEAWQSSLALLVERPHLLVLGLICASGFAFASEGPWTRSTPAEWLRRLGVLGWGLGSVALLALFEQGRGTDLLGLILLPLLALFLAWLDRVAAFGGSLLWEALRGGSRVVTFARNLPAEDESSAVDSGGAQGEP